MKLQNRASLVALFLLCLSVPTIGCRDTRVRPDGKRVVKVAYLPITHALPVFAEKEELDASDSEIVIELIRYGSWPELMDALNTGRVDAASVLVELAMLARQNEIEISAVALGHKDGNILVTSPEIDSPAELKGGTFAIPHRQSTHRILLNEALKKGNLSIDDVSVVELAPPEMPSALASGQISGYCVAEPFGAKAFAIKKDNGESVGKTLFTSTELWPESICCVFVLNDRFINKRHEDAKQLVEAYFDADGDPAKCASQFSIKRNEYDELGRQTLTAWFTTNDEPYVNDKGYASMATTYAADGSKTDTYYDADGNEVTVEQ